MVPLSPVLSDPTYSLRGQKLTQSMMMRQTQLRSQTNSFFSELHLAIAVYAKGIWRTSQTIQGCSLDENIDTNSAPLMQAILPPYRSIQPLHPFEIHVIIELETLR